MSAEKLAESTERVELPAEEAAGEMLVSHVSPPQKARKDQTGAGAVKRSKKASPRAKTQEDSAVAKPKIRIRIKAYDHKIIDTSARQIMDTALRSGCEVMGPVPLPTETRRYTVNRSTFVHKDSREQFELRVHKRLLDILNPTPKLVDALTNLNLPAGVDIEIKMG